MLSSTSSSEFENKYQTLDPAGRTVVALKTLLAGAIVFSLVVVAYSHLAGLADIDGRMTTMVDQLEAIATSNQDKERVMVFGSSMVQAGFEPVVFDAALANKGIDAVSYNYGVGNINPEFQELITRRIREVFHEEGEKLSLTLVEFNPFQTTQARQAISGFTRDQNQAVLMTLPELWAITLEDPTRGIRLLNIRYLRNGLSAELLTTVTRIAPSELERTVSDAWREAGKRRSELSAKFDAMAPEGFSIWGGPAWNVERRGGRVDKSLLNEQMLAAMGAWAASFRDPALMQADLERRVDQGDILELQFDEALVQAFIQSVNNLAEVSQSIEIILLPRNTDWVSYGPAAQARLDAVLERISGETGVKVRDLQTHPRITPEHFVDTTHLSFYDGIDVFTDVLAEEYAPLLNNVQGEAE